MILPNHKLIFIHIQKTGGASIIRTLKEFTPNHIELHPHLLAHEIRDNHPKHWRQSFKFALVRNPWDWWVSSYFFHRSKPWKIAETHPTFQHFMEDFPACIRKLDWPTDYGEYPKALDDPLSGECLVDFTGRYENLQEDFQAVCKHVGIPSLPLPHEHRSHHNDYRHYYTPQFVEKIRRYSWMNIERFGYEFGQPPHPMRQEN